MQCVPAELIGELLGVPADKVNDESVLLSIVAKILCSSNDSFFDGAYRLVDDSTMQWVVALYVECPMLQHLMIKVQNSGVNQVSASEVVHLNEPEKRFGPLTWKRMTLMK
jgi:hypothetical protein